MTSTMECEELRTNTGEAVALRISGICVRVGPQTVLRDITMDLPSKQITALVGPSGSGKSSLLRVLNRLWDAVPRARVEGSVWYDGIDLYQRGVDVAKVRSRIGMVFQRPAPFPKSIFQNIALPLGVHGVARTEIADRVEHSLKIVGLWDEVANRLGSSAMALSGGQQQRLCIARALSIEPDILLMDEPASALDPKSRRRIDDLILSLKSRLTVLLVTHHLDEAQRVSDMLGVLMQGALEAVGPTNEVFRSTNEKVAQYLHHSDED